MKSQARRGRGKGIVERSTSTLILDKIKKKRSANITLIKSDEKRKQKKTRIKVNHGGDSHATGVQEGRITHMVIFNK